ncbi:MAG: GntR family transcriptional regulator [Hyphomicrobiaceae bacterium]|nr:MAG: GntR family transcriptional regulator [Hyphomicrobiaceae bacterium]
MSNRERRSSQPFPEDAFYTALARLDRPLRAWSLIVTVFGDVVAPRGGSLWLGTLNEIMGAFGIGEGVVRTAMSRLAADGWVKRDRIGRNSYYRLTPKATALSEAAAVRIYRLPRREWSGTWMLAIPREEPGARLADRRAALRRAGFAPLNSGLFVAPAGHALPEGAGAMFVFDAKSAGTEQDRQIALSAWKLDEIAAAYRAFCSHFAPLAPNLGRWREDSDLIALALRLLVVHELRRIVLRDPGLPLDLLGNDWAGLEARALARRIWLACLKPSERWLDARGRGFEGPLPGPSAELLRRFKA